MSEVKVNENFTSINAQVYHQGTSFGTQPWYVESEGLNSVDGVSVNDFQTSRRLRLKPKIATGAYSDTHSCTVRSSTFTGYNFNEFRCKMYTAQQLRQNLPPQAWEVGWAFWDYADKDHLYYLTLKPNVGWEFGKRHPYYYVPGINDGQKVMVTNNQDTRYASNGGYPISRWYDIRILQNYNQFSFYVDGVLLTHPKYTTSATPNVSAIEASDVAPDGHVFSGGAVGFYTEDADVYFDDAYATYEWWSD